MPERGRAGTGNPRSVDAAILGRDLTVWRLRIMRGLVAVFLRSCGRIGATASLVVLLLGGFLLILGTGTGATELYEATVEGDGAQLLDTPVLQGAMTLRSPPVDQVVSAYSMIGGSAAMTVLVGLVMIVLAVRHRSWTPVALLVPAAAGSVLITVVCKQFIGRARPPLGDAIPPYEYSDSFPSGHALNSLVLAGVIAYLLMLRSRSRRTVVLAAAGAGCFTITMGLSRIYLGHHWLTDVLMAWVLGALWLTIIVITHRLHLTSQLAEPHRRR